MTEVDALRSLLLEFDETTDDLHDMTMASPGVALAVAGLAQVREDVARDLDEAVRPRLDIVLTGKPVVDNEVRVDALTRLLHSFQESVSSVAQALSGRATSRSAIPGPMRDATVLRLAAVYPGSFGATLRAPGRTDDAEALFDEPVETVLDQAVDSVLSLVDLASSEDPNDDPIVEAVLPLGSRAFKHLKDMSTAIVDQEMSATIAWRHMGLEPREAILSVPVARRLDDVLSRNRMTEREDVIVGHLGTVSDIRNRVELRTDGDVIIPASVSEEIVPVLGAYYGRRVTASVLVTTVRSQATGDERDSYVVLGLATVDEPPALDD